MKKRYKIILSLITAIGFLLFSYWVTNLHYAISGETALLNKVELARTLISPRGFHDVDSVLLINIAYDKEFRPIKDRSEIPIGYKTITDRRKLLELLSFLKKDNQYKYILLDIFFEKDQYTTAVDDSLFNLLCNMERIVIPCHEGKEIARPDLMAKAGRADYYSVPILSGGFSKYPYISEDSILSMPAKMYYDLTGRSINKSGLLYFDGNSLVRNSVLLTFEIADNFVYSDKSNKLYWNLGFDLLNDSIPEFGAEGEGFGMIYDTDFFDTKDKYIIIGDMVRDNGLDVHSTYMGNIPGCIINFEAYLSLLNRHHVVSWLLSLILFVSFFTLSYLIYNKRKLKSILKLKTQETDNKYLKFVLRCSAFIFSWFGYSSFLMILCLITYFTMGEVYDIFITSTAFYFFELAVTSILKRIKPQKNE